eukprot:XP_027316083.1 uncharacterized protein LOC106017841 [Anas platyrhynchos]
MDVPACPRTEQPQGAEPGEHRLPGFVTEKIGREWSEQKPRGLGMGFPCIFCIPQVPHVTLQPCPGAPPAAALRCPGRGHSVPTGARLPQLLSGALPAPHPDGPLSPVLLASTRRKSGRGSLPSNPRSAPNTLGGSLSRREGCATFAVKLHGWPQRQLASDFQTNTHLLKAEPRRKCEEGLRCGRPREHGCTWGPASWGSRGKVLPPALHSSPNPRSRRDLSSELASKPSVSAEGRRKTTHQHASLGSRRTRGLGAIPCLLGFDLLLQLGHPIKALLEWRQLPEPSKPYLSFLRPESSAIILQLLAEGTKNKIQ